MRRVLAPMGGAITFALVSLLVIGGLAWVTVESLHVEAEQRLANSRADAVQQERLALWRLDSRLFPAWGVENNRSYAHYFAFYTPYPVVVEAAVGGNPEPVRVPSPLLTAELPDWMTLHFQLDPEKGWDSPQVMSNDGEVKLREQLMMVFDLSPENVNGRRLEALNRLRTEFPKDLVHEQLLRVELLNFGDSPLAVPYNYEPPLPAPKVMATPPMTPPTPAPSFGAAGNRSPEPLPETKSAEVKGASIPATPGVAIPPNEPPGQPADNGARPQAPAITVPTWRGNASGSPEYDARKEAGRKGFDDSRGGNSTQVASKAKEAEKTESSPSTPEPPPFVTGRVAMVPPPGPAGGGGPGTTGEEAKATPSKDKSVDASGKPATESKKTPLLATRTISTNVRPPTVQVGPMRAVWLKSSKGDDALVLVRAARLETKTVFQGVLLDWPKLKTVLAEELPESLQHAKLEPAREAAPTERAMTALPATLDPGRETPPPPIGWTPLRIGLTLGWIAALLALAAAGFVGWTLIDLSERRIRFVSAVTHELRTPLTSLRLYLDLLSSGMISDEEKQKDYLRTLSHESERLNTLIENVLDFAKLEKRTVSINRVAVPIPELLDQANQTWSDRLTNEGREFITVSTLPEGATVPTDARIAGQIVSILLDNARKYSRDADDKRIWLWAKPGERGSVILEVEDRGPGVPNGDSSVIFRPFRRGQNVCATGGAGLGLALARQWAALLGGTLSYKAADGGVGACFRLELPA